MDRKKGDNRRMVSKDGRKASSAPASENLQSLLERLEVQSFTGRVFELQLFEQFLLHVESRAEKIINVYGIGGIGKTSLLNRYRSIAEARGALYLHADLSEQRGSQEALGTVFASQLKAKTQASDWSGWEPCMEQLHAEASDRRIIIVLDHYEEAGGLDAWLREWLFPQLPVNSLLIISGRQPLQGPWRLSPAWRRLILPLRLDALDYESIKQFLLGEGITEEQVVDSIWLRSLGHPLLATLLAETVSRQEAGPMSNTKQTFDMEELLQNWWRETHGDELRDLIMAASVARSFHQEMISAMTGHELQPALFDRLVQLSYVRRTDKGWQLHELVRESVRSSFRDRSPELFDQYKERASRYLLERISRALAVHRDVTWEVAELLGLGGNAVLRAHFRQNAGMDYYMESADESSLEELERYMAFRKETSGAKRILCADPETGAQFKYTLAAEESCLWLTSTDVRGLYRHCPSSLTLMRSADGALAGFLALCPISAVTLPYLELHPLSSAYFSRLKTEERERYASPPENPAGYFILMRDVAEIERPEQRSAILQPLFEYILKGSLLFSSPPPLPYFKDGHLSLGFEELPGVRHTFYGEAGEAPIYVLDTRKGKLMSYLEKETALKPPPSAKVHQTDPPLPFTDREREVAEQLVQGYTNPEIAVALYISEAAVKKHVNNMLQKTGLKNRTQLAKLIMEHRE
ncbi:LuxR C-terminal-related transcriptional regulator [Paenibacillus sp. GD4]|uniref:LuxR C-terminal-related transcriptional regulator n=1 Tax=Paenibacillus sp. GD4 TaxID=3068890 RepID=UPI002796D445|nr:LuxR C-terminal-related transcriptional regulator [Paenibacillus sp. GD4]MDQ1911342.1 LuxR C-terminal-related transcriptional regulator [Paenibacillus sp. GD4]